MREEDKIFDLQVRSMMENAEVKPPRGVFSAVSKRLASDEVLNRSRRTFAYVGLGIAAALAAIILVMRPTGVGEDNAIVRTEQSPVAQVAAPAEPLEAAASVTPADPVEMAVPVTSHVAVGSDAAVGSGAALEVVSAPQRRFASDLASSSTAEPSATENVTVASSGASESDAERVSISTETEVRTAEKSVSESVPETVSGSVSPSGFDAFSPEPRRRTSRVSFTAGGLVSANNAGTGPVVMGSSPGISIASNNYTILETSTSSYGVPVSLALGVRFQLSEKLSIGTGVDYSLLSRTFSGKYAPSQGAAVDADFRHTMHYLGIPLDLYYTLFSPGSLRIYVYAGGEAEYCVSNKYAISTATGTETFRSPVSGLQFSVGGGLGVEFRISQHLGIFLDPGINYYFNCHQPKNVRTEKPMLFNIDAGLRFGF